MILIKKINNIAFIIALLINANSYSAVDIGRGNTFYYGYDKEGTLLYKKCIYNACTPYQKVTGKKLRELYLDYNAKERLEYFLGTNIYPLLSAFEDKSNIKKDHIKTVSFLNDFASDVQRLNRNHQNGPNQCFRRDLVLSLADTEDKLEDVACEDEELINLKGLDDLDMSCNYQEVENDIVNNKRHIAPNIKSTKLLKMLCAPNLGGVDTRIKACRDFKSSAHSIYHPCNPNWNLRVAGVNTYNSGDKVYDDKKLQDRAKEFNRKLIKGIENKKEKTPGFLVEGVEINADGKDVNVAVVDTGVTYIVKNGKVYVHPELSNVDREKDNPLLVEELKHNALDPKSDKDKQVARDKLEWVEGGSEILGRNSNLYNHGSRMVANIASSRKRQIVKHNGSTLGEENENQNLYIEGSAPRVGVAVVRTHTHPANDNSKSIVEGLRHILNHNISERKKVEDMLAKHKFLKSSDSKFYSNYCKNKSRKDIGCWNDILIAKGCDIEKLVSDVDKAGCFDTKNTIISYYKSRIDVISMSLGARASDESRVEFKKALSELKDDNVVSVAASGNYADNFLIRFGQKLFFNKPIHPCRFGSVICMGETSASLNPWKYSYFNEFLDYVLPSDTIMTAYMGQEIEGKRMPDINYSAGTSYATSTMAGLIARILSLRGRYILDMKYPPGSRTAFIRDLLEEAYKRQNECAQLKDVIYTAKSQPNKQICAFSSYDCDVKNYLGVNNSETTTNVNQEVNPANVSDLNTNLPPRVELESSSKSKCKALKDSYGYVGKQGAAPKENGFPHKIITNFQAIATLADNKEEPYYPSETKLRLINDDLNLIDEFDGKTDEEIKKLLKNKKISSNVERILSLSKDRKKQQEALLKDAKEFLGDEMKNRNKSNDEGYLTVLLTILDRYPKFHEYIKSPSENDSCRKLFIDKFEEIIYKMI